MSATGRRPKRGRCLLLRQSKCSWVACVGVSLVASVLASGALEAPEAAEPLRWRATPAGGVLDVRVGEPEVAAGVVGPIVHLRGFDGRTADPGAPDLPQTTVLLAVPPGATVTPSSTLQWRPAPWPLRPQPVPVATREATPAPVAYAEDPAVYEAPGRYPAAAIEVSPVMQLRDLDVVRVTIRPVQYDGGALRVLEEAEVALTFRGGHEAPPGAVPLSPAERDFYARQVVNPDQLDSWVRPPAVGRGAARGGGGGFAQSADWVKVHVVERGMTAVTGAELAAAGVAIAAIDPSTLRVFWGGGLEPDPDTSARAAAAPEFMRECAIDVADGGSAGAFDATDQVVFLAQGSTGFLDDLTGEGYDLEHVEHRSTDEGVYWLTWGGSFGEVPRRIERRDAVEVSGAPTVSAARTRLHFERNQRHDPNLIEDGVRWERWWYSETVAQDDSPEIPIRATKLVPGSTGRVRVRLWGATADGNWSPTNPGGLHDHLMFVSWNSVRLQASAGQDTFAFDGPPTSSFPGQPSGRFDFDRDDLSFEVDNTLYFEPLAIHDPQTPNRYDESYLAFFQATYLRALDMSGESTIEVASPPGLTGRVNYEVTAAPVPARVFDVTDPYAAKEVVPSRSGATLRFDGDLDPGPQKIWVGAGFRSPTRIEVDRSFPNLRSTEHGAGYVVIAYDEFVEVGERLAAAHATLPGGNQPASPMVVRVSDVYDEFSGGLKSHIAIRNFIDYALHRWSAGGRPLYICILGDASYDPRDYSGGQGRVTDFVPTFQGHNFLAGGGSDFLTDDRFVLSFGIDPDAGEIDTLLDAAIGRLPAGTLAEAEVMVDEKTIPYIQEPPGGAWRQRFLLTADDNRTTSGSDEGVIHAGNSEAVQAVLPPELEFVKVYLHDFPRGGDGSKPEARQTFIERMSDGAALVNYIGHGNPDVLAHETMFRVEHSAQLTNGARLPMFFTFSCTVNRFDVPGAVGIGEALVEKSGGGAVSSVGATDLSFIHTNQQLNLAVFGALYDGVDFTRPVALGQALVQAKNGLVGARAIENARKYVLLGDPALVMATPRRRLVVTVNGAGASGEVDSLAAGHAHRLRAVTAGGAPVGSSVEFRLLDSASVRFRSQQGPFGGFPGYQILGAPLYRGGHPPNGSAAEVQVVVPIDAAQSETETRALGQLRAFADDGGGLALGALPVYLDVVGGSTREPPPAGGPEISASFDGDPGALAPGSTLEIRVSDPSGVNISGNTPFNSLFVRFDEERTEILNEVFAYEPGSVTTGGARLALAGLGSGPHTARIFASDNYLNRSEAEVSFTIIEGGPLEIRRPALYPNPFSPAAGRGTMIGFELPEPATVTVRIYTLSGRLVRERFGELERPLGPGTHQIFWNGIDQDGDLVANGVYIVKISAKSESQGEEKSTILRSVVSR